MKRVNSTAGFLSAGLRSVAFVTPLTGLPNVCSTTGMEQLLLDDTIRENASRNVTKTFSPGERETGRRGLAKARAALDDALARLDHEHVTAA